MLDCSPEYQKLSGIDQQFIQKLLILSVRKQVFNSLANNKIVDLSKWKVFADDKKKMWQKNSNLFWEG